MKPKTICCFLLLLLCVALITGCNRSPAGRIETVLNRCAEISKKASAMQADNSVKAGFVADEFQSLDVTGCPPDFRAAFQEHINAWRQAQSAYANNTVVNNVAEGVFAAVTENPNGLGAVQDAADSATQDINSTYYNLTEIAARYGARIPRSAVADASMNDFYKPQEFHPHMPWWWFAFIFIVVIVTVAKKSKGKK